MPDDLDGIQERLLCISNEKIPQTFEFRLNKPWVGGDGVIGETWMTASGYPDFDQDGNIKEIMGTMSDVSRYKWAESVQKQRVDEVLELKRQQEKYESSPPNVGNFVDIIFCSFIDMTSHEVRRIVVAILQVLTIYRYEIRSVL